MCYQTGRTNAPLSRTLSSPNINPLTLSVRWTRQRSLSCHFETGLVSLSLCIVSLAHLNGADIITVQQRSTIKPKILTFERRLFVGTGGSSSRCRVPGPPSWGRFEFRALFLPTLVASLRSSSFRSPGALQRRRPPSPPVGRRASLWNSRVLLQTCLFFLPSPPRNSLDFHFSPLSLFWLHSSTRCRINVAAGGAADFRLI